MRTVLHVTECLGGGVESAIAKYIAESPASIQHRVLAISGRNSDENGDIGNANLLSFEKVNCSYLRAPWVVSARVKELQPDYVHLHSAFAGLFGRVSLIPKSKIVYTPHCYAFEMRSCGTLARVAFRVAEELLALRTGLTAACGAHEAALAGSLHLSRKVVALNNAVSEMEVSSNGEIHEGHSRPKIGMLGRVCRQKGVPFYTDCVRSARAIGLDADFVWIGGGDPKFEHELRESGVEVTGWLSKEAAVERLRGLDAYVHSAEWEGNPISIIEAAALRQPVFARNIASVAAYGEEHCFNDADALAKSLVDFFQHSRPREHHAWRLAHSVNEGNRVEDLREALSAIYGHGA